MAKSSNNEVQVTHVNQKLRVQTALNTQLFLLLAVSQIALQIKKTQKV